MKGFTRKILYKCRRRPFPHLITGGVLTALKKQQKHIVQSPSFIFKTAKLRL